MHDYKVWELYNPTNIFKNYIDDEENKWFQNQVKHYTSEGFRPLWSDAPVKYDMLWDIIPHTGMIKTYFNHFLTYCICTMQYCERLVDEPLQF